MKYLIFSFLIVAGIFSHAQHNAIITTLEQHQQWMDDLSKKAVKEQKKMIADRIVADTNIFFPRPYCILGLSKEIIEKRQKQNEKMMKNKMTGCRMPLILVDGYLFSDEYYGQPNPDLALSMAKLILRTSFKTVSTNPLKQSEAAAIYGARGSYGIITMQLKNKKDLIKFKSLIPNSHHKNEKGENL